MRFAVSLLLLAFASGTLFAQQQPQQQQHQLQISVGGPDADRPSEAKATPEQKKLGTQLLQRAEIEAAGLPPGMRAYALAQVANGYARDNRGKAVELLETAFSATRAIDDDGELETRNKLQRQILTALVPLAPGKVDDYLPQLAPTTRKQVLESLLAHYQIAKQLDHAIELVYRISHESEFPYAAGSRIIQALPPDQNSEAAQLFTQALASFREHKHEGMTFGAGADDFGDFVVRNWKRVAPATVKESIYEALKQAQDAGKSNANGGGQIAMASDKGSLRFNTFYEYRLFQLLPVLRNIDPDEAEKLIKEHKDADALLAKYPDGASSFMPPLDDTSSTRGNGRGLRRGPGPGGAGAGAGAGTGNAPSPDGRPRGGASMVSVGGPIDRNSDMAAQVQEMQRAAKIAADAEEHPQDALANASAIQNKAFRAQALMGIARVNVKKNTSVAKSALSQAVDLAPDMPDTAMQMFVMRDAANLYLQLDDTDGAKKIVEKGMALADKAYKSDANADDPNKALKAYWPSTEGYRSFLRVASKISPQWAATLLKDIADPEIKVSAETAMALQYMGMPGSRAEIITAKKDGMQMMMTREQ